MAVNKNINMAVFSWSVECRDPVTRTQYVWHPGFGNYNTWGNALRAAEQVIPENGMTYFIKLSKYNAQGIDIKWWMVRNAPAEPLSSGDELSDDDGYDSD